MDNNTKIALVNLRVALLESADKYQHESIAMVSNAKSEAHQFNAAKTIGIVQGYLESIKEIDKILVGEINV